ncbi:YdeI/OmpD-associated family protein [Paenibacillus solisilvae]|uniref:YdeI/OmpD-associated family protein n=1 Tax=Paenibacillus solisilvae TaxID=2486751 RepID=A0ABW0VY48_9BACL
MNAALVNKLGLTLDMRILVLEAPDSSYEEDLGVSKENTRYDSAKDGTYDFVLLFASDIASLKEHAPEALKAVKKEGLLWICYPEESSKIRTDINRLRGWRVVTDEGYETISMISVDETWTAKRFRLEGTGAPKAAVRSNRTPITVNRSLPPQELTVPDELIAALTLEPAADAFFVALAPLDRREYVDWINEAKDEEARNERITATVAKLLQKLKRPSDKA